MSASRPKAGPKKAPRPGDLPTPPRPPKPMGEGETNPFDMFMKFLRGGR